MAHEFVIKLIMSLSSHACKWAARAIAPYFRTLQNAVFPIANGSIVSLQSCHYFILEQRRNGFNREYKLVNIGGINPFLLPLLAANPYLVKGRPTTWYQGPGIRKVRQPKLSIRMNMTQRVLSLL